MTHEELREILEHTAQDGMADEPILKALRAVVELHKPSLIPDWVPTDEELMCWCAHIYPCPTIQRIIENLK